MQPAQGGITLNTRIPSTLRCAKTSVSRQARLLQLALVVAAAVAAFVVLPSGASAVAINTASFGVSNTQAGSHPDVNISFTRNGTQSEDLKEAIVELPPGMFANPEAPTSKCAVATFNTDKCTDAQQVGTMSVDITAAGLLPLNIPGAIYVLQPNANDTATLGLVMRPNKICILFIFCAVPQKVFLQTNIKLQTFDTETGLKTYTSGAPKTTTVAIPPIVSATNGLKLDITIEKMGLSFFGKANKTKTGKYFMVASTSCRPSVAKINISTYNGGAAAKTASYTPTNCPGVPFNPTFKFTPGSTQSGAATTSKFVMDVPATDAAIQNAHPQIVDIDFPNESAVELGALSGVVGCSEALLRADQCPAASQIGTSGAIAPYLPPALTGSVYAMDPINTAVPMAVVLRGARGTRIIFRGILGVRTPAGGPSRAYARFDAIPQLPYAQVTVDLAKNVYRNPNLSTCGTQTSTGNILGYNGKTAPNFTDGTSVTRTSTYTLTGCNPAPNTTITSRPLSPSSDITPTWTYTSDQPNSTFFCSIDGGPAFGCSENNVTSGTTTTGSYTSGELGDGPHTFSVYAVNGVTADATPDTDDLVIETTFTITTTIVPSTTAPAAHPNIDFTADIAGGQPGSLLVKMPDGFAASLKGRPLCSVAAAQAGTCDSTSSIGPASLTVNTPSGPETGTGNAYLTAAPTGADAGGVSIEIDFSFGKFIAGAGAYVENVANKLNQFVSIRSIPDNVNGTPISVTQLKINFIGDIASGNRFLTNGTSCNPSQFLTTGTTTSGAGANPISAPYQSTGCNAVIPPFNPSLIQTLTNPVAGDGTTPGLTGVIANVNMPQDNGSIKKFVVLEPSFLAPNFEAFGNSSFDQCKPGAITDTDPSSATNYVFTYSAANCPPQARVGQMTINTPLLPNPLVGDVFLVARGSLPSFGVKFDQPGISVRLAGLTRIDNSTCDDNGCPDRIQVTFDNVPDTPVSSVVFALNDPDRQNYNNTITLSGKMLQTVQSFDPLCTSPQQAQATVTSWANQVRELSQDLSITGCNP